MKKLIIEKTTRVTKNRKKLEKELDVSISYRGREIYIDGEPESEYAAEKIIEALSLGFPLDEALQLKEEEFMFEMINIKDYTNKKDTERIKGRIIGKDGRAKNTLSQLTKCDFEIKDNIVGIIGPAECMENAQNAIISLIKGSKHANIYGNLERNQPKPVIDLGIKESFKEKISEKKDK